MFHIHNVTIVSHFLFFFVFFQYCLNSLTFFWELWFTFAKRISKKAFGICWHTSQAHISGLALSPLRSFILLLSTFCKAGSISTSLWIVFSRLASKSLTLLCLVTTNPPILQFMTWFRSYFWPHGQLLGIPWSFFIVLNSKYISKFIFCNDEGIFLCWYNRQPARCTFLNIFVSSPRWIFILSPVGLQNLKFSPLSRAVPTRALRQGVC